MNITFRQFRTDDLLLYENWRNDINAQHHMSNFYPPQFNGEIVTSSNLYVWYVFLVDGADVGTIWLEKENLHDSVVSLGIMIGHPDKLGIGLGQQVIPLAIELAHAELRFEGVQLSVRKTNSRAIGCYKACGFRIIAEGTYINRKGEEITFFEMYMRSD
jgi:RimJ/RimL family protein N-acetyltransferase